MAFLQSGGSVVGSAQIVDGAIVNADINAAAAIALTKLGGLIGNPGSFLSIETTSGQTHSLTTVANQRVLVIAKIDIDVVTGDTSAVLAYGGVTKDSSSPVKTSTDGQTHTLMYTEVPGAATADITITAGAATVSDAKIIVIKLQESA